MRFALFESYGCATPLLRSYVGEGLGKCPAMTSEILDVVLALAVGMVGWGSEDAARHVCGIVRDDCSHRARAPWRGVRRLRARFLRPSGFQLLAPKDFLNSLFLMYGPSVALSGSMSAFRGICWAQIRGSQDVLLGE